MEYLRLDTKGYAATMAQALAILHWRAKLDANDVEFVLGSAPEFPTPPTPEELWASSYDDLKFVIKGLNLNHTAVGMWLLDFDQCQSFPEGQQGVEQLVKGFYHNDPYYPRPVSTHQRDVELWHIFKSFYLEASACLTDSSMPKDFIEAVEVEGQRRRNGGSIFQ